MKSFVLFFLCVIPIVSGTYFRKERILYLEELVPTNEIKDNASLRGFDFAVKLITEEGNEYIISKTENGVKITDGIVDSNWNIVNKKYVRGFYVNDILQNAKKLVG